MSAVFDILLRLAGVLVLVALNAFFVSAEFAIVSARRTRLDQLASAGNAAAALGLRMKDNLARTIAATQLGVTLASLALGAIGEPTIAALVEPPLEESLTGLLGSLSLAHDTALVISHAVGVALSYFILTTFHVVLGEQAPKVFAYRAAERHTMLVARPLLLFSQVFAPVIRFLDWATDRVMGLFGIHEGGEHAKVHSAEELRLLVEESGEAGVLDEEEQEMLINVFAFADRPAYQAMLPRTEVVTIDHDASVRDFLGRFAQTGHTRFPITGPGGVDDVRGIISAKDLLVALNDGSFSLDQPITPLIRPAFFTPESKRVGDLMQELRAKHIRMAILIDEYGGMAGVVTMEDLIEEIVGDLDDELDREHQDVRTIDDQTIVVEGQIRVEDVNEELDLNIPAGDYETLAGFILSRLGRLPTNGDTLTYNGIHLTVLEMQGPRIKRIEIKRQ